MPRREPSIRSALSTTTISPPPTYTAGRPGHTGHAHHPSIASSVGTNGAPSPYDPYIAAAGGRREASGHRPPDGPPHRGVYSPSTVGGGDTASMSRVSVAPTVMSNDLKTEIVGFNKGGDRNITNYINISRKATPHHRIFSLFYPNPKIIETFYIDPHLRVPGGVLSAVQGSSKSIANGVATTRTAEQGKDTREGKNLSLVLEDGKMNATIFLIAECDPSSTSATRRLRSRASMATELNAIKKAKATVQRTTITASLNTTRPKTFKAFPMFLRIHAPQPRPPFHLQAICTGPSLRAVSRSPVTLFLPYSFHGPIILHIQVGNIDNHLWISPALMRVTRLMAENDQSRGYFVGVLPDRMDEEGEEEGRAEEARADDGVDWAKQDEEWPGDKVEIEIGNGRLRILFEDERLEGMAETSSNGWIWPAKWG